MPRKILQRVFFSYFCIDFIKTICSHLITYAPLCFHCLFQLFESITMKDVVCEGDAQIIGMRGKRKHVCDITATINYIIKIKNNENNDDEILLKIFVIDITSDKDFEFEFSYPKISAVFTASHRSELVNHTKILKKLIVDSIGEFLEIFALK